MKYCLFMAIAAAAFNLDGGTEGDAGPADPCYLDDGNELDVGSLAGCNGPPPGAANTQIYGEECAHQPDEYPYFSETCAPYAICYPASQWYRTPEFIREGECGVCMKRCRRNALCPDGVTTAETFDFCRANCPDGMRCWLGGQPELGVCVIDCFSAADCKTGLCDPLWHICIPRDAMCADADEETDSSLDTETPPEFDGSPTADTDSAGGNGGLSAGGCRCASLSRQQKSSLFSFFFGMISSIR